MTAAAAQPSALPTPMAAGGVRRHAREEEYRAWVWEYVPHEGARWERMRAYRRFIEQWPNLPAWFAAPLPVRLGLEGGPLFATGRTAALRASGYLVYLALVHGVGLDADYILGRKYARLLSDAGGGPAWAWTGRCSSRTWLGWPNSATRPRRLDRI